MPEFFLKHVKPPEIAPRQGLAGAGKIS
jgi:hypothetical protein